MKNIRVFHFVLLTVITLFASSQDKSFHNWPCWRGVEMTGVARHANPPIIWDENTNIRWKVPIPGKGLATPIVWGNQIFILTAKESDIEVSPERIEELKEAVPAWMRIMGANIPHKKMVFTILSYQTSDGAPLWEKELRIAFPHAPTHKTNS